MSNIELFKEEYPSLESYWRSIILFGRNVATYKFALAKSLLEIIPTGKSSITLNELAEPFSRNICEHLKIAPKQITSSSSRFLETCQGFNDETVSYDQLIDATIKLGFNNVIDAFHVVNNRPGDIEFYKKDYSYHSKKIVLTDEIFKLQEIEFFNDFVNEAESRWNLVETAMELGISRSLLNVQYDDNSGLFFINSEKIRRKDVTSARDALNGYQKGKCFYCFDDITINTQDENSCDVDHYFPYLLQPMLKDINLNGIWNLVLTCTSCNRGSSGKFAQIPATKYLERLHKRNEFLISSHHPLRETIMNQTGHQLDQRIKFLKEIDRFAINKLINRWQTDLVGPEIF